MSEANRWPSSCVRNAAYTFPAHLALKSCHTLKSVYASVCSLRQHSEVWCLLFLPVYESFSGLDGTCLGHCRCCSEKVTCVYVYFLIRSLRNIDTGGVGVLFNFSFNYLHHTTVLHYALMFCFGSITLKKMNIRQLTRKIHQVWFVILSPWVQTIFFQPNFI